MAEQPQAAPATAPSTSSDQPPAAAEAPQTTAATVPAPTAQAKPANVREFHPLFTL